MSDSPWKPCKIRAHPDGREVLFVQHQRSRFIRKGHTDVLRRMSAAQRDALPRYRENPKFLTRGASGGGELDRWPQVGDVVYCGDLVFGECVSESKAEETELMRVRHRDGSEAEYLLDALEVVHHNIAGMGREDDEGLVEQCLLEVRTVEEIDFAASEMMEAAVDSILEMPSNTKLDCDFILGSHDRIFGQLFRWGGRYRWCDDIVVGKQQFKTPAPQVIPALMTQFEANLQTRRSRLIANLTSNQSAYWKELAWVYFRFCEIHPFRDGNGRVSRLLLMMLMVQTMTEPVPLNWSVLSRSQTRTDNAFEAARLDTDLWPLAQLIYKVYCATATQLNKKPPNCRFDGRGVLRRVRE